MNEIELENFALSFDTKGKLRQIKANRKIPILFETDYEIDLKDGRIFSPCGWDQCFPSIEALDSTGTMGELIGKSPCTFFRDGKYLQTWEFEKYCAACEFEAHDPNVLNLRFKVDYSADSAMRFLWASHSIFDLEFMNRILFPDKCVLDDFSLNGTSRKYFIPASGPVEFERNDLSFRLETDQPFWGIWLNRGGWPAGNPAGLRCIGVEATSQDSDKPKNAAKLKKGKTFEGWVRLVVTKGPQKEKPPV